MTSVLLDGTMSNRVHVRDIDIRYGLGPGGGGTHFKTYEVLCSCLEGRKDEVDSAIARYPREPADWDTLMDGKLGYAAAQFDPNWEYPDTPVHLWSSYCRRVIRQDACGGYGQASLVDATLSPEQGGLAKRTSTGIMALIQPDDWLHKARLLDPQQRLKRSNPLVSQYILDVAGEIVQTWNCPGLDVIRERTKLWDRDELLDIFATRSAVGASLRPVVVVHPVKNALYFVLRKRYLQLKEASNGPWLMGLDPYVYFAQLRSEILGSPVYFKSDVVTMDASMRYSLFRRNAVEHRDELTDWSAPVTIARHNVVELEMALLESPKLEPNGTVIRYAQGYGPSGSYAAVTDCQDAVSSDIVLVSAFQYKLDMGCTSFPLRYFRTLGDDKHGGGVFEDLSHLARCDDLAHKSFDLVRKADYSYCFTSELEQDPVVAGYNLSPTEACIDKDKLIAIAVNRERWIQPSLRDTDQRQRILGLRNLVRGRYPDMREAFERLLSTSGPDGLPIGDTSEFIPEDLRLNDTVLASPTLPNIQMIVAFNPFRSCPRLDRLKCVKYACEKVAEQDNFPLDSLRLDQCRRIKSAKPKHR